MSDLNFPAIYTHSKVPDSEFEVQTAEQAEALEGLGWKRAPKTQQPEVLAQKTTGA